MNEVLAFFGGKRLNGATFTADGTWVAPMTTTALTVLGGRGQDGSPGSVTNTSRTVTYAGWLVGGSGSFSGTLDWSTVNSAANAAFSAINAGGSVNWTEAVLSQYDNGTYSQTSSAQSAFSVQAGTASMSFTPGWQTSGPITGGGSPGSQQGWNATVNFSQVTGFPSNGASSTAFGYTFAGGIGGPASNGTAPGAVPVTPGATYNIVVAPGGYISFSFYE